MAKLDFKLNGKPVTLDIDPSLRLLDVLRNQFQLTGPKEGCGEGECGACSVLLDGHTVNSCCLPIANIHGREIVTIEGYAKTERFKVLEEAMAHEGGSQCGICTPGMMIAAESLLNKNPQPTDADIRIGLSGNLCRCTGYNMIIKAVQRAAKKGAGSW
ncbi:MAG: (2Fe-2S)-binding protein [Acholeplasmataceae bacterium]|nr:MAG: (2Fe-2S)-binding protein [Acholeplasmataceae bacterium]